MTTSPEAYAYYLQAMAIGGDFGPGDDAPRLHDLLDRALKADPSFARAYAIKSRLYGSQRSGDDLATEFAEKALELDPDLGLAHYALGYNHWRRARDAEALESASTALSLSPNDPNILDDTARFYANIGSFDDAIQLASRLHDIDPGFSSALGVVTMMAGDIDASLQFYRQSVQYDPGAPNRHLQLAIAEKLAGNQEAAIAEANLAIRLATDSNFSGLAAYRYRAAGLQEEADRRFDLLVERSASGESVSLQGWALAYAAIADHEKAFEYLELIAQEVTEGHRSALNAYFAHNIYDDPMLETPEFIEVRKRLGYDMSGIL
jgi:Flp pilus assembly protein TadD